MKNCTGNAFHNNAVHCKAYACVSFANCIDALSVYVWFKVHVFIFRMTCCQVVCRLLAKSNTSIHLSLQTLHLDTLVHWLLLSPVIVMIYNVCPSHHFWANFGGVHIQ